MLTLSQMCICNFIQGNGAFYLVNFYYNFRERVREVSGSVCICRDPTLLTFLLFCCVLNIFWGSPYILGRIVINIHIHAFFLSRGIDAPQLLADSETSENSYSNYIPDWVSLSQSLQITHSPRIPSLLSFYLCDAFILHPLRLYSNLCCLLIL